MKQINSGSPLGIPTANNMLASVSQTKTGKKTSGLSNAITLLGGAIMLSLQLFTGKANAQIATYAGSGGTSTSITYATNATGTALTATGLGSNSPCGSGGLSGLTNNGVTTFSTSNGRVYFTITANPGYLLNVTGFTAKLRRSGSGLSKVRMAYYTTGGVVNDLVDKSPDNSSCGAGSTVFSWSTGTGGALPTGVTTFTAELFPYAPIASGGTIQFNNITVNGSVVVDPSTVCPTLSAGTVTPSTTTVCAGTGTLLSLGGYTVSGAVTFQWQSAASGSGPWTNITGATNTTYNAAPAAGTTYYRANTTCILTGGTTVNSSTASITANAAPNAGAITGSSTVNIGSSTSLANGTASSGAGFVGVWSSGSTSVATIDAITGEVFGVHSGTSIITYTVTNTTTGCDAYTTAPEYVIYPGDLAIYEGSGGTSTAVTGVADETVTSLSATGFGTTTGCTTGGLSGLTMPTSVVTYNTAGTGPHISYVITPTASNALNVTRFWVSSRSSGTGPDSARLAYRIGGGAWISEGFSHVLATGGSCGAYSNSWSWTPSAALNGITSNIEIGIFPYHPGSSTGTFQLQRLEVIGTVTSATPCSTTPAAGVITPASTIACVSGYANLTFAGDAGTGISYQWQQSVSGGSFTDISGASNVYYTSPVYTVVPTDITYQVVTTCAGNGSATSAVSVFSVTPLPSPIDPLPTYLLVGSGNAITLTQPDGTGKWFTQYPAIATIDSLTGLITGNIAGITAIIYRTPGFGCVITDTIKVIQPGTLSVYLGVNGNSTLVTPIAAPYSATELSAVSATGAFGANTPCSRGGISGLTVPTSYTSFSSSNPYVSYTMSVPASATSVDVFGIYTTVRSSGSGPASYSIAYRVNGGTWTDAGFGTDIQNCGISSVDQNLTLGSPVSLTGADVLEVGVFPYGSVTGTGTFQVNTIDIVGSVKCPPVVITNPIDGGTYGSDCDGLIATATVPGGTWSSSNTAAATIDPSTGVITFFNADDVTDIIYTAPCGNVAIATINVPATSGTGICDGTGAKHFATNSVNSVEGQTNVTIYPNPARATLNVATDGMVNISVYGMDGKLLIEQKETKSVNVSKLATGVYMVKISNTNGTVVKTARFEKY